MKKADLIKEVAETQSLTRATAEKIVNTIFSSIINAVAEGDNVRILEFGNFTSKHKNISKMYKPMTREFISIPARRIPHFKPCKKLRTLKIANHEA